MGELSRRTFFQSTAASALVARLLEARETPAVAAADTGPQRIESHIGTLEFTHDFANGYPTDATVDKLYDERDFQRACQAYLWSLPAVAFTAWQRGINTELGAKNGQIVAILSYEARALFRFCGPEKPLFEKTWKLPDIERVK